MQPLESLEMEQEDGDVQPALGLVLPCRLFNCLLVDVGANVSSYTQVLLSSISRDSTRARRCPGDIQERSLLLLQNTTNLLMRLLLPRRTVGRHDEPCWFL